MLNQAKNLQWGVLAVSLVVYLALAVWMAQTWLPLGDEPHYLLAAHSLVHDGDLNLANNYAARDFQAYLPGETLDPHVKIMPDGTQILNHDLGLPLLIAPPYAVGGRAGVEIFFAVCAALLAWQMWKLAFDVGANAMWATLAWALLAFTPPLVLYATVVYPELIGSLIFLWATRTILFRRAEDLAWWEVALLGAGIFALPWLSVRFVVLFTLLILFIALRWSGARRRTVVIYGVAAVGILSYLVVNGVVLQGTVPRGNPTELAGANLVTLSLESLARGVSGWWIDPQRGTLILAPIYLLALAGIPRLVTDKKIIGAMLIAPLVILVPLVAVLGGFWVPFEVGARYFVVALPLLAAPLALALKAGFEYRAQWARVGFGVFATLLALLSFWNGALMVTDAAYAYGSVVTAYSRALGMDVSPLFASMGHVLYVNPVDAPADSGSLDNEGEEREGEPLWFVQGGEGARVLQSADLSELTVGHYTVDFRAGAEAAHEDAELLTLDIYSAEGFPIVHTAWSGNELASDSLNNIVLDFDNPYFDRWGLPLTMQLATSGGADLTLSAVHFDPDNATTWVRAGVWIALVLGVIVVLNWDDGASKKLKAHS